MTLPAPWAWAPSVVAMVSAGWMVIDGDRRRGVMVLALIFLAGAGVTAFGSGPWMALVTLLAGGVAIVILWLTAAAQGWALVPERIRIPSGRVFRLLATILVGVSAIGFAQANVIGLPVGVPGALIASMVLIGLGILQTGLSEEPLRVGIGLLTMLAGFDLAYGTIEPAVAVTALMAATQVALALVVAYLLTLSASVTPPGTNR